MERKNITLRPFQETDCQRILEILTSVKVNQTYMLPDYETQEDAIPLFGRLMELSYDDFRYVRCIDLGGCTVGFLNDVEIKENAIELGYVIHPDSQSHGYMTEALWWAIRELFELGYQEIICGAFEDNIPSIRVMEKCGMKKLQKTDEIEYRARIHRCVYYSIKEG